MEEVLNDAEAANLPNNDVPLESAKESKTSMYEVLPISLSLSLSLSQNALTCV